MGGQSPPEGATPRTPRSGRGGLLLALAVVLGLVTAVIRYLPSTEPGRALFSLFMNGQRVGDLGWLKVSGVEGDLWSRFTIARLEIADRRGAWFVARDIVVQWRAKALWRRRVQVLSITARETSVSRAPTLLPSQPDMPPPIALQIDRISAPLILSPAFAGTRGLFQVTGAIDLERNDTATLWLDGVSASRPDDRFRADIHLNKTRFAVTAHAVEAKSGAMAGSLGLDAGHPFTFEARAQGGPDAGAFTVTAALGARKPAQAQGSWAPAGGTATAHIDLAASRWLVPFRKGLGDDLNVSLVTRRLPTGLYQTLLRAKAAKAGLEARGDIDFDRLTAPGSGIALTADLTSLSDLLGVPGLGAAQAKGVLTGDSGKWGLVGVATLQQVVAGPYSLASIKAPFTLANGSSGLTLKAEAQAFGGLGDGPVAILFGKAPTAAATIDWLADGRLLVRRLALHGDALDVTGTGERDLFGGLAFTGNGKVRNLGRATDGHGGVTAIDGRATQGRASDTWLYALRARGQAFRSAWSEADAMLGPEPRLDVDGRFGPTGLGINQLVLVTRLGVLKGAGTVGPKGEIAAKATWSGQGTASVGPMRLTSGSRAEATASGSLDHARVDLSAFAGELALPDGPVPPLRDVHLLLVLADNGDHMTGAANVTGSAGGRPAHLKTTFSRGGDEISLDDIDVVLAGASLAGQAKVLGLQPTAADLRLIVDPGPWFTAGHVEGRLQIAGQGASTRAHLAVSAADVTFPDGGGTLRTARLTADGPLRRLPYLIDAHGVSGGLAAKVTGSGNLAAGTEETSLSFIGVGKVGPTDFQIHDPATILLRAGRLTAHGRVGLGKGLAEVSLTADDAGTVGKAVVTNLDLTLLDPDVRGRGEGVLNVTTLGGALVGTLEARVSGLMGQNPDSKTAMAGTLGVTFGGGVVSARTALTDTNGSRISADVRLPAKLSIAPFQLSLQSREPMSGHFSANGALGPLWDLAQGEGYAMTGHVTAEGSLSGTLADPRITGTAGIDNGDFEDPGVGLKVRGVTLRAALKGDAIDIERFSATDGARGSVTGDGRLSLLREGASGLSLTLKDFRLLDTTLGQAAASGTLSVDRAADGKVRLAGALTIDRAQISPSAQTPVGVVQMDVIEIHRTVDPDFVSAAPARHEPPVALDLSLKSPGGVFIKGRGLNLEMSLDAKVSGTTASPALSGVARVVRGDYEFAGKRFQIDDTGIVYLGSTPEAIRLNITASRDDPTLTARIQIGGTAAAPTLTLTSTPALPKDEILSQILFGASAAQLSGLQAAQLASALAGLAGTGGFDVVGGLRNFAHLDRLAIDTAAATGTTFAGGKYIRDNIYVELSGGARSGQGAQVEWRLFKHLAIVSRVTSQGDHAVSVRWRKDY